MSIRCNPATCGCAAKFLRFHIDGSGREVRSPSVLRDEAERADYLDGLSEEIERSHRGFAQSDGGPVVREHGAIFMPEATPTGDGRELAAAAERHAMALMPGSRCLDGIPDYDRTSVPPMGGVPSSDGWDCRVGLESMRPSSTLRAKALLSGWREVR